MTERIRIDVPATAARRDKVEREVFGRLAAIRTADRADAVAPHPHTRRWIYAVPLVAALAIGLVVAVRRDHIVPHTTSTPSLVVTPVGGSSRFTVGDAVIDASGDTSVKVDDAGDAVVIVLDRGSIDCDVTPRNGRPPFRVVAGDVEVEVIGTRFAVTRVGVGARVDVIRGKVRVHAPAGERFITAGESWTPSEITASVTPSVPPAAVKPTEAVEPVESAAIPPTVIERSRTTRADAYRSVQHVAAKDPRKAARDYRTLANGDDAWAALALFDLAELHTSDPKSALRDLDELARRFPTAANAEDAAWLRVDIHHRAGQLDDARRAAADYLRAFPQGTYLRQAARLASPP